MSLKIHTSNRMEQLVEDLAKLVTVPLDSPFTPEKIVVQSKGMQRWLAMELAKKLGVWANCHYPFPNRFVGEIFKTVLPDLPEISGFEPETVVWRIMGLLPHSIERPECAPLRSYLAGDGGGLKQYQLAGKIADCFDQYTMFRPKMLAAWEAGHDCGECRWQASLWRQLVQGGDGWHRGRAREAFLSVMRSGTFDHNLLPERISVFGLSSLPSFHLEVFAAIAQYTDVHLYLLSPCREYWGDIVPSRVAARQSVRGTDLVTEGNPLLASMGKLGRDFSELLLTFDLLSEEGGDSYLEPGGESLLQRVQSDILNLQSLDEGEVIPKTSGDRSVQFHSCHSPLRELEVLHDNLLAMFEADPGLAPRDILVMTPDIEVYAPYITAVYSGCGEQRLRIPYSIADRNIRREGEVADLFLAILGLSGSRFGAAAVMDILEAQSVRNRFDLDATAIDTIRGWLAETKIRWGVDEEDRRRAGVPPYRDNSWRAGLDRLLLGYAMSSSENRLFHGILPCENLEGDTAQILGRFVELMEKLFATSVRLAEPRPLAEWSVVLRGLLDDFILANDETAREMQVVVQAIDSLREYQEKSAYSASVDLSLIRSLLETRLEREERGLGFMTGGVTFCAMLPMRSIPFKVIALIGMNDGSFPRQNRQPGFDLIAQEPRRGDRSLRDEDRYLFLEAILSARECLYISFVGQSLRDNSELPPSVLVSELHDYLANPADETKLITRHRLQAFSHAYFDRTGPLFSYSRENYEALVRKQNEPTQVRDFIDPPLAPPGEEWRLVPLTSLLRFYDNPARFLLNQRLGIRLEKVVPPLEEREPFAVEGLEAYGLKQELLEQSLKGNDLGQYLPIARSNGVLPPGRHGELAFVALCDEITCFADTVKDVMEGGTLEPLEINLECAGFHLTGRLDRIWLSHLLRYRCAKVKEKDLFRTWLEHLVLNAAAVAGYPRASLLAMLDGSCRYRPVDDAAEYLEAILARYWQGLCQPLRFFPVTSFAYARNLEWDLGRARKAWEGSEYVRGEQDDSYFNLCFGASDPFSDDFTEIARQLLEPMLLHHEEV